MAKSCRKGGGKQKGGRSKVLHSKHRNLPKLIEESHKAISKPGKAPSAANVVLSKKKNLLTLMKKNNQRKANKMKPVVGKDFYSKIVAADENSMDTVEKNTDVTEDITEGDNIGTDSLAPNLTGLLEDVSSKMAAYGAGERAGEQAVAGSRVTSQQKQLVASSTKAFYQEFKKVVEASDVIVQVLDARDPMGTRSDQVEQFIRDAGPSKRLVLILNKADLVPLENLRTWLTYLRQELPTVAFKSSTSKKPNYNRQRKYKIVNASEAMLKTSPCFGVETLLNLLSNYCKNKDIKGSLTVGVVGYPNVGKSSLINSLKRERACNIGNVPGVTREMQTVKLNKNINLLDSPGLIVSPETTEESALRNAVKVSLLDDVEVVVETLFKKVPRENFSQMYGIKKFNDCHTFLCMLAQRRGFLKKRGLPNSNLAAKLVLNDWNSGKIKFHTAPPRTESEVSSKIVQKIADEFDLASLEKLEIEEVSAMATMKLTEYKVENGPTSNKSSFYEVGEARSNLPAEITRMVGNQQLNRNRKKDFKKMKKDAKRRDKLAGALSRSFEQALADL